MRGQDILVLLKLAAEPGKQTVRSLAAALGLDPAGVHRSLRRLEAAGLLDSRHERVNSSSAMEFLLHGFKYAFPPDQGGMSRGVPTAWAAPPLSGMLAPLDDPPMVWPDPDGGTRGIALKPLHASVPAIARKDPLLTEELALLDAIRVGDARVRSLAAKELEKRLKAHDPKVK